MGYIYKITNIVNNKIYIGLTTQTIKERWRQHVSSAYSKKSKSYNEVFKKAIRKYGENSFRIEEIDNASTLEELKEKERYWIAYYNCCYANGGIGYNGTEGGDSPTHPGVEVYHIDILTGEIIETFPTIKDAEQKYGRGIQEIISGTVQRGEKPIHSGTTWIKAIDYEELNSNDLKNKFKVFCQLDKQGKLINLWLHQEDAAQEVKCSTGNIGSCLIGQRLSAGGYQWCYYKDLIKFLNKPYINTNHTSRMKKVYQYDKNYNLIDIFKSATEAAQKTNTPISKISAVCNNHRKTANGYIWSYIEIKKENMTQ